MPRECTDGTTQTLRHCLIRNPELVSEFFGGATSWNVVVSHSNGEHQGFALWFAQAIPWTNPGIRGIVDTDDLYRDVRVLTAGLILAQRVAVREPNLEFPSF